MNGKMHRPGARRVTLRLVARRADVDPSVVSRVINGDETLKIRDETRQRVLQAIEDLKYQPNAAARSLRTARAGTLGLFIPDFGNPVYSAMIAGAEAAAADEGLLIVTGTDEAAGRSKQGYLSLIGSGRVDGVLLAGGALSAAEQNHLKVAGVPYLLVNRRGRDVSRYVLLDDNGAARLAVRHLTELGHESIALIGGPGRTDTARRRRQGYLTAMRKAGLDTETPGSATGDYTPAGGYRALMDLLDSGARPTAVLVANIMSAVGVTKAAEHRRIRVPEDLSVIAIHDMPLAGYLVPALTTVRMPLREMGDRAVRLLLSHDRTEPIRETVAEPMSLVVRESTSAPR
ncbi:LacI family DNA-binding transcriptional regulator [Streptomyces tubercidicus]|uniref:LacI family DNA-binding transcriptional regulator n=1 Tax=Streptomyces tubercidicus TaxID=47759 RepID=UPI0034673B63